MSIIDNSEIEELTSILEEADDQLTAVALLKEFNQATKEHGLLLMNLDESLDSEEWKKKCDEAKKRVERVVAKIRSL